MRGLLNLMYVVIALLTLSGCESFYTPYRRRGFRGRGGLRPWLIRRRILARYLGFPGRRGIGLHSSHPGRYGEYKASQPGGRYGAYKSSEPRGQYEEYRADPRSQRGYRAYPRNQRRYRTHPHYDVDGDNIHNSPHTRYRARATYVPRRYRGDQVPYGDRHETPVYNHGGDKYHEAHGHGAGVRGKEYDRGASTVLDTAGRGSSLSARNKENGEAYVKSRNRQALDYNRGRRRGTKIEIHIKKEDYEEDVENLSKRRDAALAAGRRKSKASAVDANNFARRKSIATNDRERRRRFRKS